MKPHKTPRFGASATTLAPTAPPDPAGRALDLDPSAPATEAAPPSRTAQGGEGGVGVLTGGAGGDPSHPPARDLEQKDWFAEPLLAAALGVAQSALKNARPALVEGADWQRRGPGGAVVYRERAVLMLLYCLGLTDEAGAPQVDLPAVLAAARAPEPPPEAAPLIAATVQRLPISLAHVFVRLSDARVLLARVNKKRRPELKAGSAVSVRLDADGKLASVIFEGGRPKKRRFVSGQSGQGKEGVVTGRPAADRPLNLNR